jgi:outer membrane receptor protein involved in Fe transport
MKRIRDLITHNPNFSRAALKAGAASFVLAMGIASAPSFAAETAAVKAADAKVAAATDATEAADAEAMIVVTGTLFKDPNTFLSSPVGVISEKEIAFKQSSNAESLLRDVPGVVPSIGSQVNNGNGGASYVNLRGLGVNRNLVLLDGARVVPAGINNGSAVDLNNIPIAMIQRVDILTGGATTTYGADAISGVVNFVTKRDFSGLQVDVTNGLTQKGDGNSFRAEITFGANLDDNRGNVVMSLGYQKTDGVYQGARDFSVFNISSTSGASGGSGTTVPGRFNRTQLGNAGSKQIDPVTGKFPVGSAFIPFNFNPYNIFQTPVERWNFYTAGRYEITDAVEAYGMAMFNKNSISTIIAPSGTFGNTLTFNYSNPYLPAAAAHQFCGFNGLSDATCNAAIAATGPTDPNYKTFTSAVSRRFVEAGPRITEYTTTMFQYKGGLRGKITDHLNWDLYGLYGQNTNNSANTGQGLLSRLKQETQAVKDPITGAITCAGGEAGCVPMNLFGAAGTIDRGSIDYINVTTTGSTFATIANVQGTISGDLGFNIPTAEHPVQIAIGADWLKYQAGNKSDLAQQTPGEVLGSGGATPDVRGQYSSKEVFGELQIPIVENRPGFEELQLEVGARYADYTTAGSATTWKVGGTWAPIAAFKIRGNYNKSARAPNIFELFSPTQGNLDNLNKDACAGPGPFSAAVRAICVAQGAPADLIGQIDTPSAGQVTITTGGNPNLGFEHATTWTIGTVIIPPQLPGITASIDYYNITVNDAISTPTINDVYDACWSPAQNPTLAVTPACTSIRRNPGSGMFDGTSAGYPELYSNLGRLFTDGIDATINGTGRLGNGQLSASFTANYTFSNTFQATPTSQITECAGFYGVDCTSIQPKFTFNQRTTYAWDAFTISLLWRYLAPVSLETPLQGSYVPEFEHIGAKNYFDLTLMATPVKNVTFTLLINNLFNVQPPLVGSTIAGTAWNSGNTFPSTYDPLGRRFTIGASVTF